jgi:hypothetical protein
MFAETAIVEYNSSFANQGNKLSFSVLQKIYGSLSFPFSVCRKETEVAIFRYFLFPFAKFQKHGDRCRGDMEPWRHRHGEMET